MRIPALKQKTRQGWGALKPMSEEPDMGHPDCGRRDEYQMTGIGDGYRGRVSGTSIGDDRSRQGMSESRKGLILINTGPGKGKTTAALGTGLRAVGVGMRVLMLQFLKGSWHYGELDGVKAFGENFELKQMGRGFVKVGGAETDPEDLRMVEEAWAEARAAILSGEWDVVILDEINYAIGYGMLDPAQVAATLLERPEMVHVILTGRNAHPSLVEIADTVTEMREVKHAYQKGILAQRGIEY